MLGYAVLIAACASSPVNTRLSGFSPTGGSAERVRVLELYPGVTATVVAPAALDTRAPVELIVYAPPNGNTTAQTMGRTPADGFEWRYDIQHIGAQTRALRTRGVPQAVVAYVEAEGLSWGLWRSKRGTARANARIVELVDELRTAIGNPEHLNVTLTAHSGGGSFVFGFIDAQDSLPEWVTRLVFLDANYNFEARHAAKLVAWLNRSAEHRMVVMAYDDREIMLDGKKVVSDSGGTWRASHRMLGALGPSMTFARDTLGPFVRFRAPQADILLHPNPQNRILHTAMIGEMNGYLHAMLAGRPDYERGETVLKNARVYSAFVEATIALPPVSLPNIPLRAAHAIGGSAFMASVATLSRDAREAAVRRELLAGNVPSFLRVLRPVQVEAAGPDSVRHTITYDVMPDYLAIGSDDDFVRIPMTPYTAQAFCDAFGFVLPTRKMVDDIWQAAPVHRDPRPMTVARDSAPTFLQHHRIIEEQLADERRGVFVAGIKKDVVVTNKLQERANRVAIYGWHYLNGAAIQGLYTGHVDWYVDYSHGIRPVRRWMLVDGVRQSYEAILTDPQRSALLSDEGVIAIPRYEKP